MPTNPTGQMLGAGRCGLLSPPCGSSSSPPRSRPAGRARTTSGARLTVSTTQQSLQGVRGLLRRPRSLRAVVAPATDDPHRPDQRVGPDENAVGDVEGRQLCPSRPADPFLGRRPAGIPPVPCQPASDRDRPPVGGTGRVRSATTPLRTSTRPGQAGRTRLKPRQRSHRRPGQSMSGGRTARGGHAAPRC